MLKWRLLPADRSDVTHKSPFCRLQSPRPFKLAAIWLLTPAALPAALPEFSSVPASGVLRLYQQKAIGCSWRSLCIPAAYPSCLYGLAGAVVGGGGVELPSQACGTSSLEEKRFARSGPCLSHCAADSGGDRGQRWKWWVVFQHCKAPQLGSPLFRHWKTHKCTLLLQPGLFSPVTREGCF